MYKLFVIANSGNITGGVSTQVIEFNNETECNLAYNILQTVYGVKVVKLY